MTSAAEALHRRGEPVIRRRRPSYVAQAFAYVIAYGRMLLLAAPKSPGASEPPAAALQTTA